MAMTQEEVKAKVRKLLVDAGVDSGSADYIGDIYANSPRGKEHQKDKPDATVMGGNNCAVVGILPIG